MRVWEILHYNHYFFIRMLFPIVADLIICRVIVFIIYFFWMICCIFFMIIFIVNISFSKVFFEIQRSFCFWGVLVVLALSISAEKIKLPKFVFVCSIPDIIALLRKLDDKSLFFPMSKMFSVIWISSSNSARADSVSLCEDCLDLCLWTVLLSCLII